ncbi:uncharacterized protein LOC124676272 [Lolium rigidum]|uniref:uncharacterized protein LOC124676272 n=1 Tax=Lolium rigidum TaxID=89674 RepID=UPI001F5C48BB|nr:uncharacterized protein LOC124676272 [Lolium rigidum]
MGFKKPEGAPEPEKPDPQVLVPPVFDFPPIEARTRMLVPAYELMFGKLARRSLFDDYLNHSGGIDAQIMLKQLGDSHVDLTATMSTNGGEAHFRWQRDLDDPHTFVDLLVSTSKPTMQLSSCVYHPKYRIGAFGTVPLIMANRACSEDYGVMGLRYGSENLSVGASFVPFCLSSEVPYGAWFVGRKGNLSAGMQYKPLGGSKHPMPFTDLKNWNCAISYGVGSTSPLSPSFTFALELVRRSQLVASFYQHQIFGKVLKYRGGHDIIGTLNYIDLGLELSTRVDKDKPTDDVDNSMFQIAAGWQLDTNLLVKGKLGPSKSSAALAYKFPPFFTCSFTVENDHFKGTRSYGLGIRVEDLREPSYKTLNPEYTVLKQYERDLDGKKRVLQFDACPGNYDHLPPGLKPIDKVL